jgi:hypothetical protein
VIGFWVGEGAVVAGIGVGEDDVAGDFDVGGGAVTAGFGVGEDISGVASVHPAGSNITSVRGIKIIDSFFILVLLVLISVEYSIFSITTICNVRLRYWLL